MPSRLLKPGEAKLLIPLFRIIPDFVINFEPNELPIVLREIRKTLENKITASKVIAMKIKTASIMKMQGLKPFTLVNNTSDLSIDCMSND